MTGLKKRCGQLWKTMENQGVLNCLDVNVVFLHLLVISYCFIITVHIFICFIFICFMRFSESLVRHFIFKNVDVTEVLLRFLIFIM